MVAEKKMKVVVLGAGLGGLACAMAMHYQGFDVVVYEKVRQFARLGDSLGLGENALKLLDRWGVNEQIKAIGNKSPLFYIRRYDTGEIIATQRLLDMAGYIGHRGDYHNVFLTRVKELGIPVHMGNGAVAVDESVPSCTLASGEVVTADLIVGADGIKSVCRELVLGYEDAPKSSGYACYRAYGNGDLLKDDPLACKLVEKDTMNVWIGPDQHIVQNTCKDGKEFNWISNHVDHESDQLAESWQQPGRVEDAVELVKDWDPRIVRAMSLTPTCLDWKIVYRDPLPTWVSKTGRVVLIGDSAHPHLPTSAQGASQAVEDSAVIALCLKLAGKDRIRLASLTFERLRYARVLKTQKTGESTRKRWHTALNDAQAGKKIDPRSIMMPNAWIYALDAEADVRERWDSVSAQIQKELDAGDVKLPGDLLGDDKFDIPGIPEEEINKIEAFVEAELKKNPMTW